MTEAVPVTPSLLIATSYDSESTCFEKYPEARGIVERIRSLGATVYFDVDATKLDKHKDLRKLVYDTVVFNFPHVGEPLRRDLITHCRVLTPSAIDRCWDQRPGQKYRHKPKTHRRFLPIDSAAPCKRKGSEFGSWILKKEETKVKSWKRGRGRK